jgi:cell division protein FtsA
LVLVDLGAERTNATVHRDGVLQGMVCIGAGAAHVTRDLAFALQVDVEVAEDLKRSWGAAWKEGASEAAPSHVPLAWEGFASVIEPRMRELLQLVRDGLQANGALAASDRLVLTGGGAKLRATADLAHAVFRLPVRLAAAPEADAFWSRHRSQTLRGLWAYAQHCGFPAPAPRWIGAVQRLRGAFVAGGEQPENGASSSPDKFVKVARHGDRGMARVGVDLEVHDVRVRTGV